LFYLRPGEETLSTANVILFLASKT
jgi:hypothetical protein